MNWKWRKGERYLLHVRL